MTVDFGFGVGFRRQRWIYVWVSMATVGLALGFNSAGGGFVVGLMDGLGFAVGLDLGFEGGGLGFGFDGGGFGFAVGFGLNGGGFRLKW